MNDFELTDILFLKYFCDKLKKRSADITYSIDFFSTDMNWLSICILKKGEVFFVKNLIYTKDEIIKVINEIEELEKKENGRKYTRKICGNKSNKK